MNPHFVFNALNSIQTNILKEDTTEAVNSISRFSSLMRMILESSTEKLIPLKRELEILTAYLDMETIRFKNKIHYSIVNGITDPNVLIPSMLVQPFVENAIKHGLLPKPEGGFVKVNFFEKNGLLFCRIEDSGVGQQNKKSDNENKKSLGMKITKDRLLLLCSEMNCSYYFEIKNRLNDQGQEEGIIVIFSLPYTKNKNESTAG